MDARTTQVARLIACVALIFVAAGVPAASAQHGSQTVSMRRQSGHRTANFVVRAPTAGLAREIGEEAERLRRELAIEWVGQPMANWAEPCPITAQVSPGLGAGGATSFVFDRGEVFNWEMNIQGSRERVLDSVLPHEITHTVFATHFRRPLPRWADEGACTTVEHESEVGKMEAHLVSYLKTGRGIPFTRMFAMKEYPRDILPLYAQGHSLAQFLMEGHGRQKFLSFLADGMRDENWRRAVRANYGHESLYALQTDWLAWVKKGRPHLDGSAFQPGEQLASAASEGPSPVSLVAAQQPSVYAQQYEPAPAPPVRKSVYDAANRNGTLLRKPIGE